MATESSNLRGSLIALLPITGSSMWLIKLAIFEKSTPWCMGETFFSRVYMNSTNWRMSASGPSSGCFLAMSSFAVSTNSCREVLSVVDLVALGLGLSSICRSFSLFLLASEWADRADSALEDSGLSLLLKSSLVCVVSWAMCPARKPQSSTIFCSLGVLCLLADPLLLSLFSIFPKSVLFFSTSFFTCK